MKYKNVEHEFLRIEFDELFDFIWCNIDTFIGQVFFRRGQLIGSQRLSHVFTKTILFVVIPRLGFNSALYQV